ncbi:hypothetical protein ACOSQ4_032518 [Xanthoceras sorbifolium]
MQRLSGENTSCDNGVLPITVGVVNNLIHVIEKIGLSGKEPDHGAIYSAFNSVGPGGEDLSLLKSSRSQCGPSEPVRLDAHSVGLLQLLEANSSSGQEIGLTDLVDKTSQMFYFQSATKMKKKS